MGDRGEWGGSCPDILGRGRIRERERWAGLVAWMPSWAGQLGHGWPSEGGVVFLFFINRSCLELIRAAKPLLIDVELGHINTLRILKLPQNVSRHLEVTRYF